MNTPAWWGQTPGDLLRAAAAAMLVLSGTNIVAADDRLLPRVEYLELEMEAAVEAVATVDSTHDRRLQAVEEWKAIDLVMSRFSVCRALQEDNRAEPAECWHILRPYESVLLPEGAR
jgi:hypothetical protein